MYILIYLAPKTHNIKNLQFIAFALMQKASRNIIWSRVI